MSFLKHLMGPKPEGIITQKNLVSEWLCHTNPETWLAAIEIRGEFLLI